MDKYLRYSLEVLFHRTSPVHIINRFVNNGKKDYYYMTAIKQGYERLMRMEYNFLSIDEIHNAAQSLEYTYRDDNYSNCGVFTSIFKFAKSTLWEQNGAPCIKFDELLRFRDTTHSIGTDIFICAFLAEMDYLKRSGKRIDFGYPTSILTDNLQLQNMLSEGLAENHFHLKGSTPAFMLSWICLMNNVKNRRSSFEKMKLEDTSLNSDLLFVDLNENKGYYGLVMKAAKIRFFLASILNKNYSESDEQVVNSAQSDENSIVKKTNELKQFLSSDDTAVNANINKLQREINIYQKLYCNKIGSYDEYMDYAIQNINIHKQSNIVFTGERKFLYDMFYAIISEDKCVRPYLDLFYAYILISSWFRGELVQNNNRTGFANFQEYQNRKDFFIEGYKAYENALIAIALESNLEKPYIRSLEARFVPREGSKNIQNQVLAFDRLSHMSHNIDPITKFTNRIDEKKEGHKKEEHINVTQRHFYVSHFTKSIDGKYQELRCRHHNLRRYVKNCTKSIAFIREKQYESAYRIFGIDACANEIGCRPEVFAQPFRFLKNHHVRRSKFNVDRDLPQQLRITYHAGEDFLDVSDGLRAIDEAVDFLNMTPGDRLGHALALGIDVENWYLSKNNRIILPRQDLIDNAAWMIYKLSEYGYSNKPFIYELKNIYKENYLYVFQQKMPFQGKDHFIDDAIYIDSWRLRGDDPYLYRDCSDTEKYLHNLRTGHLYPDLKYNYFARNNPDDPKLNAIRENYLSVYKLVYYYHFDKDVRNYGNECVEYGVSGQYINAVKYIQERMRFEIAQKGIGIECNPSSNYLIGTLKRYDQHPIINFNNHELGDNSDNARMFVSINTDDLGVFDTTLENEYALIACALKKVEDGEGNKKYNPNDIYEYLDYVRRMGLTQSFSLKGNLQKVQTLK